MAVGSGVRVGSVVAEAAGVAIDVGDVLMSIGVDARSPGCGVAATGVAGTVAVTSIRYTTSSDDPPERLPISSPMPAPTRIVMTIVVHVVRRIKIPYRRNDWAN